MPRYEYKCKKCDKNFEVVHGINENVDTCKFCGSEVRRVFHPVGIVFKGSGFYSTDSRIEGGKKRKPQAEPDSKEKKPEEDKKETADTPKPGKSVAATP
jgi:putative FmdB family regulatory protein